MYDYLQPLLFISDSSEVSGAGCEDEDIEKV